MRNRRATSLVEMLVVMSAASTILSLTGVLIQRVMHASSRADAFHAEETTAWRLSDDVRRDAAAAGRRLVEVDGQTVALVFQNQGEESLRYSFGVGVVERSQPRTDGSVGRETYPLASVGGWKARSGGPRGLVEIEATPATTRTLIGASVPLRIVLHGSQRLNGEATP